MKAYKVERIDMMGIEEQTDYFLHEQDADSFFMEKLEEFKKSQDLVSEDSSSLEMYQSDPIVIRTGEDMDFRDGIKEASIAQWYRCSYEYEEYDIMVTTLRIVEIDIFEGKESDHQIIREEPGSTKHAEMVCSR